MKIFFLSILVGLLFFNSASSQETYSFSSSIFLKEQDNYGDYFKKDTIKKKSRDTSVQKKSPQKIAAMRSLMFPGLGQIYNKKYWKLPLVYGAIAIPTAIFFYNIKWYNKTRFAYKVAIAFQSQLRLPPMARRDSTDYFKVDDELKPLIGNSESLRRYRDDFRQNVDYAALFFLLAWSLNIVDAAVDAHLKNFDVNENLTLKIKPGISPMAQTTGISLVFTIGKHRQPTYKPISFR